MKLAGYWWIVEMSGRGWAALNEAGEVQGRLFLRNGDDSGFRAV